MLADSSGEMYCNFTTNRVVIGETKDVMTFVFSIIYVSVFVDLSEADLADKNVRVVEVQNAEHQSKMNYATICNAKV